MRRSLTTTVALVTTTLTLLATAGTAHAGSWTHRDARGDVFRASMSDAVATADPADRTSDITRFGVRHSARKVTLTLSLRDLRGGSAMTLGRLVTPTNDYQATVLRSADLRVFSLVDTADETEELPCRGKRASYDNRRDRITITIPRTCLGSPTWVRAGAGYARGDLMSLDENSTMTFDEALRRGSKRSVTQTDTLKVGKKVRVG
ncbi:MAG TPA: hypothetical protein VMF51_18535 [Nocardioides sp.]|uniref:hypothetical protein n=1 Tax=Nocardioides sp. TaxID=35761 RepID=UPI002BD18DF4|nr:hypothetical protein [Nocardioides sp.]HTW17134.1 hypothetical protein [Nocardioides sp.]